MGNCKINKDTIMEYCVQRAIEMTDEYNERHGADKSVVVVNDTITFPDAATASRFVEEIDNTFTTNVFLLNADNAREAILYNTKHVEEDSAYEQHVLRSMESPVSTSSDRHEFKHDMTHSSFIADFMKTRKTKMEQVSDRIVNLYAEFKSTKNMERRNEILHLINVYSAIKSNLEYESEGIGPTFEDLVENVNRTIKTLNYMIENMYDLNEPNLIQLINENFRDIDLFMKEYGNTLNSKNSEQTDIITEQKIKNQRFAISELKRQFEIQSKRVDRNFIITHPLYNSLNIERINKALANPDGEDYKALFGGANITDINFLEKLGLAVDRSSSFDGVLAQTLTLDTEATAQENMNWADSKKRQFIKFSKELKRLGIDLEDENSTKIFQEVDKNGNATGNLVSVFMPEWRKRIGDFLSEYKDNKYKAMENIAGDCEMINVFKFAVFHNPSNEFELQFQENVKKICDSIEQGLYSRLVAANSRDISYEKKVRELLGDAKVDEMIDDFMLYVNEYYYRNSGNISDTQHLNPINIMLSFNDIHQQKLQYGFIKDEQMAAPSSIPSASRMFNYKKLISLMIPTSPEYYSKEFRKIFISGNKTKTDAYQFIAESLKLMNSMYLGKTSLNLPKIAVNYKDEMLNSAKGIVTMHDLGSNLRSLKKNAINALEDSFFKEDFFTKEGVDVARNYSDKSRNKKATWKVALENKTDKELEEFGSSIGLYRKDYDSKEDYVNAIATKKSLEGFETNMFSYMMKMFDLYAAQKTRNEIYPVARMIERMYKSYKNVDGRERENANARLAFHIRKGIQRINEAMGQTVLDTKLLDIEFIKNVFCKFDKMPILNKIFSKKLLTRLTDDEKELVKVIKENMETINQNKDIQFTYNGETFLRETKNGQTIEYIVASSGARALFKEDDFNGMTFNDIVTKYYEEKLSNVGTESTIRNVIDLIQSLLVYKALAGVSTSGIFNRIEGHNKVSLMDSMGYYNEDTGEVVGPWKPGNLAVAEKYFFGSGLFRYLDKEGGHLLAKEEWKATKRYDIVNILAGRTDIFQNTKNQFDKTIEGEQKGRLRHNLDLFQLSIDIPEFKNQMSIMLAMMMDVDVYDKNGNVHKMFDKETGEFTCYDVIDGELVLKPEFDTEYNKSVWINLDVNYYDENGQKKRTASKLFFSKVKEAIVSTAGDYRKDDPKMYSEYLTLSQLMFLKRWLPESMLFGWKQSGKTIDGKYQANINLASQEEGRAGMWNDMIMKSKSMMLLPLVLSTTQLQKGILKTGLATGANLYLFGKTIKNRCFAKPGEIEHNVSMMDEFVQMAKASFFETLIYVPRVFGKKGFDVSQHSFNDEKYIKEYGLYTLGNFRAAARMLATRFYITLIGVAAKLMFWDPDDGDDDTRRKMYNWMDNNMENILNTTTDTIFVIDNLEDKFDVSNVMIIKWFDDMGRFIEACNEMDKEKMLKYGTKNFMPIRFSLNPFTNDYEFVKDSYTDKLVKNYKTDGEWGSEQDVKDKRKDLKEQYVKLWEKKKLPDNKKAELDKMAIKDGYKDIYSVPEKMFSSYLQRGEIIPSKRQKQYKNISNSLMSKVLEEEYEKNPDLQKHTLKWMFGSNDNRLGTWFGRDLSTKEAQDDGD